VNVLRPGERTRPVRHNSTQLDFCIRGGGHAVVGGRRIDFERYDVWNTPSMATYTIANDGDEPQVRLTYSNAALLEKLNIHVVEDDPPVSSDVAAVEPDEQPANPFGTFSLGDDG